MLFKKNKSILESFPVIPIKKITIRRYGNRNRRSYILTLPMSYLKDLELKPDEEVTVYGIAGKENRRLMLLEFPRNPVTGQN